ncbi:hypothetical protein AB0F25_27110 [Streptomyces wedmorensis]|uniref:hypothetical protein n=1 Tax=Streptomyces wedmorensis TaxID=43759 RepID=UPI003412264C
MYQDHFRFAAARALLAPFLSTSAGIPEEPEAWAEALEPALRALWDRSERGGATLYEVGAEVRAVGEALAAGGSARERVPQDLSALAERSGPGGAPGVWREIADHVDAWPRGVDAKLAAWVPSVGELRGRFPKLEGMLGVYFGQDGIAVEDPDLTDTERIGVFVADCHGRDLCTWRLPPLVGECAEALALFSDDALLGRFFGFELLLGSSSQTSWTAWLNLISDTLTTHLRREHGPLAWTGGREEPKPC